MKNSVFYLIMLISFQCIAQQRKNIKIGEQIGGLVIENVEHFTKKQISTNDLIGKWTILDFWTTGCTACVQSFPKINELQKKFPEIQFILITNNDRRHPNVKKVYDKFRKHLNLELPIAFDSLLFKKFEVYAVPFIVVLDPNGKVHSMPASTDITETTLRTLINNEQNVFTSLRNEERKIWKYWINLSELDVSNVAFQSILMPNKNELTSGEIELNSDTLKGAYQVTGAQAMRLYMVAHSWHKYVSPVKNQYWPVPVLDTGESKCLLKEKLHDEMSYNYRLLIPKVLSSENFIRKRLAIDLDTYFGTEVVVEVRDMPYWSLTALPALKINRNDNANKHKNTVDCIGIDAKGITIKSIISIMLQYVRLGIPIVDETNIKERIDLKIEAVMTDFEDVQKALRKQGLQLEKKFQPMQVLVIKCKPDPRTLTLRSNSHEK